MGTRHSELDRKRLRRLYESDTQARTVLDHMAELPRGQKKAEIDVLLRELRQKNIRGISRRGLIAVFRRLAELGAGDFQVGRRGHPTRFESKYDMHQIGLAGSTTSGSPFPEAAATTDDTATGMIAHRFVLRPSLSVELCLPADLTRTEANRLADFVRTLPFEQDPTPAGDKESQ